MTLYLVQPERQQLFKQKLKIPFFFPRTEYQRNLLRSVIVFLRKKKKKNEKRKKKRKREKTPINPQMEKLWVKDFQSISRPLTSVLICAVTFNIWNTSCNKHFLSKQMRRSFST